MREVAYQLSQQTGTSFLPNADDDEEQEEDEDVNPFLDTEPDPEPEPEANSTTALALPPRSHLPALISVLPTLSKPTIIILDAFDLFAMHARQSLLYCLLDTAQSCRAGPDRKGISVIGVTSRVDTINLLEKRVKSRFSGRTLRTAAPNRLKDWVRLAKAILCVSMDSHADTDGDLSANDGEEGLESGKEEWTRAWQADVDRFLKDKIVLDILNETFSITRDVRMLIRILVRLVRSKPCNINISSYLF